MLGSLTRSPWEHSKVDVFGLRGWKLRAVPVVWGSRKDFGKQLIAAKKLRPDANLCLPSVISDGKF